MCGQCGLLMEAQDSRLVLRRTMGGASHSTPASWTTRVAAARTWCRRSSHQSALATATLVLLVLLSAGAGAEVGAGAEDSAANSIDALEESASRQIQQLLQQGASGVATAAQGRIGHRLRMIFPLVIAIATRLGTLVPIGLSVLGGVTLMVMFAKKAFIVSLLTLGLVLWDKWTRRPPAPPPPTYHPPPTFVHHAPAPTHPSWAPPPPAPSPHDHWPPAPPPTHAGPHWVESGHPVLHSPAHAIFQGHMASPSSVYTSYSLSSGGGDDDGDGGGGYSAQASAPVRAQRKPPAAYYPFPPQRTTALAGARRRGVGRGGQGSRR